MSRSGFRRGRFTRAADVFETLPDGTYRHESPLVRARREEERRRASGEHTPPILPGHSLESTHVGFVDGCPDCPPRRERAPHESSPRHPDPRCKECGERLGDADRAEVFLTGRNESAWSYGPFVVHADPCYTANREKYSLA